MFFEIDGFQNMPFIVIDMIPYWIDSLFFVYAFFFYRVHFVKK